MDSSSELNVAQNTDTNTVQISSTSESVRQPLIGIFKILSEGWMLMRRRVSLFGYAVLAVVLGILGGCIVLASSVYVAVVSPVPSVQIGGILSATLGLLFMVMYLSSVSVVFLRRLLSESVEETSFFADTKNSLAQGISFLVVGFYVTIITNVGYYALLVPGIAAYIYLIMAQFIVVQENVKGLEALTRSVHMVRGYWWVVLCRLIAFPILQALAIGIPTIVLIAVLTLSSIGAVFAVVLAVLSACLFSAWFLSSFAVLFKSLVLVRAHEPFNPEKYKKLLWVFRCTVVVGIIILPILFAIEMMLSLDSTEYSPYMDDGQNMYEIREIPLVQDTLPVTE